MAKQFVENAGTLLIGSTSGASDLYDGTQTENVNLTRSTTSASGQAIGDKYAENAITGRSFEITATVFVPTTATTGMLAIGDTCYAKVLGAQDTPSTLFDGACIVTSVADAQAFGAYQKQSISLRSNGAPTTG